MSAAFIPFLVPIGLLLFLLEVYFLRKKKMKITLEQTALNISLGFVERLLGLYLTEKSILLLHKTLNFAFFETLPKTWWVLAITFIALDLIWYIFHIAGHRISLMWGIHLVHHHSEEFNLSVNFALSPLGFILRSFMYCSLVVFGLPVEYVILSSYLNAFYQYYLHTQFINTIPYLEKVFVMPAHHQVHHGSNELYLDKNFGGVFIFWDRLFRTYQPLVEPVNYGLTAALPHRDFFNLQTFFFKKLLANFKSMGFKDGIRLLFVGPENQSSEIPSVLPLETNTSKTKLIIGVLIYVLAYQTLIQIENLVWFIIVFLLNFIAIIIINGINFSKSINKTPDINEH